MARTRDSSDHPGQQAAGSRNRRDQGGLDQDSPERAALDRRTILASSAALLAEGCATCAVPKALGPLPAGQMAIGDTHAHLFNAADLPVVGFLQNVLLPTYLAGWEALWPAILGVCADVKLLAMPADRERAVLEHRGPAGASGAVPVSRFSETVADTIERHLATRGTGPLPLRGRATSVDNSYALLALLLAEASARQRGTPGPTALARTLGGTPLQHAGRVDRSFIARVAISGSDAVRSPVPLNGLAPGPAPEAAGQLPSMWDGLKFAYALVQSRCSHVEQYLRTMASPVTRTVRVVNLLVDYDQWVGDGPMAGSGTVEQLKFWTEYRAKALQRLAIETFAPYDPLRHAEDRLRSGNDEGYFRQVRSWADGTAPGIAIAGFKLYPPMGFRAKGNAGEPPTDRAGAIIRERWAANKWPIADFGRDLESSLDRFFGFCGEKHIPILAHARNSNQASAGAGRDANPAWWLDRVRSPGTPPLRICLAHFSPEPPPDEWGPAVYRSVLDYDRSGPSEIYLDLAFADELLKGNAKGLMEQVAALCAAHDPDCQWFMFGTDWIMLAQLHQVERYIPELWKAAHEVPFWTERPQRLANLLRNNLDRFLRPL